MKDRFGVPGSRGRSGTGNSSSISFTPGAYSEYNLIILERSDGADGKRLRYHGCHETRPDASREICECQVVGMTLGPP